MQPRQQQGSKITFPRQKGFYVNLTPFYGLYRRWEHVYLSFPLSQVNFTRMQSRFGIWQTWWLYKGSRLTFFHAAKCVWSVKQEQQRKLEFCSSKYTFIRKKGYNAANTYLVYGDENKRAETEINKGRQVNEIIQLEVALVVFWYWTCWQQVFLFCSLFSRITLFSWLFFSDVILP